MRVLYATAELAPLVVVGGLASASAGLVGELRRQEVDVEVVLPDYGGYPLDDETVEELDVPAWVGGAQTRRGTHPLVGPVTLVDAPGIARDHPYLQADGTGWVDNDRRFLAFSRAVAAIVRTRLPDVVHLNDWHTATALAALDGSIPSVLSIHNLAYQGWCGPEWLTAIGPRAEAFAWGTSCNPLAGGLVLTDAIVAVSPTYAREIVEPANGFGLHALLGARQEVLFGIRNGIDTDVWDPATDPALAVNYDARDTSPKGELRTAVRAEVGLADTTAPLVIVVTRLTGQKGVDLVLSVVPFLERLPAQLAVLGAGEADLAAGLRAAAAYLPEHVAFVEGYDEGLSHRLFAGGDLLLMPSRFEPCGLAQMQAMRYGTIPVVTDVGGLHDTVLDADAERRAGTGFVAAAPDPVAVLDALHRAVRATGSAARRKKLRKRGMTIDWSWREPAAEHVALYERLAAATVPG